jgi:hypothetical protein
VAAYLQYQKICSTNLAPFSLRNGSDANRNIQDLDEYSMQKFLEDMVGPITEPSYKRYVRAPSGRSDIYRFRFSILSAHIVSPFRALPSQIPRIFYWITLRRYQVKLAAIVPKIYQDGISAVHASQDIASRERVEQLY